LAKELYELRKRGKPVTLITTAEYLEHIHGSPNPDEGQEWKEGGKEVA
jgi:hypothetical protein